MDPDRLFRRGATKRAASALPRLLARLDRKGGLALVRLWRAWDDLLGPEMAALMRPLGHRERTLILATEDAVVAQEASFLAPLVLEKVHEFLGQEVFDKVHFELLNGRVPLGVQRPRAVSAPPPPPRPERLGELAGLMREDSPLGRCYRAYVRLFAVRKNEPSPPGTGGQDERRQGD